MLRWTQQQQQQQQQTCAFFTNRCKRRQRLYQLNIFNYSLISRTVTKTTVLVDAMTSVSCATAESYFANVEIISVCLIGSKTIEEEEDEDREYTDKCVPFYALQTRSQRTFSFLDDNTNKHFTVQFFLRACVRVCEARVTAPPTSISFLITFDDHFYLVFKWRRQPRLNAHTHTHTRVRSNLQLSAPPKPWVFFISLDNYTNTTQVNTHTRA